MERNPRAPGGSVFRAFGPAFASAVLALALSSAWLVLGVACESPRKERARPVESSLARVDVYLGCSDPNARSVVVELESAELRAESGERVALELARTQLVPAELGRRLPLAGASVPPDNYSALVLRLRAATLAGPDGPIELRLVDRSAPVDPLAAPGPIDFVLPVRGRLARQDALTLFVDWNVAASLTGGAEFAPAFALTTERPRASLGLLYVADGAGGAVLAVDRSSGEVVATHKAGAEPRALALARDRRRLFVANARDGSLDLLDLQQGGVLSTLTFGLSARSSDVALVDRRGMLVVAQRDLDKVSLIDAGSFSRVLDLSVGRAPVRLASAPDLERVFVVDSGAYAVEVVDLAARAIAGRIPVESRPSDAAVDRRGRELFVGHTTSPNLLVFDANTLVQRATIFVGGDVTAVLCDRRRDRVFVARSRPCEIVVVDRAVGSVLRRIPMADRVEALAQPVDGAELYGAAPDLGALVVVDVVLGKELPPIRCGGRPLDVLVAD
ncbi:MAG: hypothetical protein IPJ77_10955 [Planctomycetes bacterium]|nr:hypothetical protein [Planctomycetota bacterium]